MGSRMIRFTKENPTVTAMMVTVLVGAIASLLASVIVTGPAPVPIAVARPSAAQAPDLSEEVRMLQLLLADLAEAAANPSAVSSAAAAILKLELDQLQLKFSDLETSLADINKSLLMNPQQTIILARLSDKVDQFSKTQDAIQESLDQQILSVSKAVDDRVSDLKDTQGLLFTGFIGLAVGVVGLFLTLFIGLGWIRRQEAGQQEPTQ